MHQLQLRLQKFQDSDCQLVLHHYHLLFFYFYLLYIKKKKKQPKTSNNINTEFDGNAEYSQNTGDFFIIYLFPNFELLSSSSKKTFNKTSGGEVIYLLCYLFWMNVIFIT